MATETIKIEKKNALQAYKEAPESFKKTLATLLGYNAIDMKITDRVKTFTDACEVLGLDPDDELPFKEPKTDRQTVLQCFTMMIIITEALNEEWVADYSNGNQAKYYPYFDWDVSSAGFGFTYTNAHWTCTTADVGARLSFKTEELATYAGKQFISIYNGFITPKT